MEITLCVRGCAKFDCDGKAYTPKAWREVQMGVEK